MENKAWLMTVLGAAVLVAGCGKEPTTAPTLDKVQTEAKPMARDMKDYTFAEKAEFVTAMQAQLTALDQNLDKLSAKMTAPASPSKPKPGRSHWHYATRKRA